MSIKVCPGAPQKPDQSKRSDTHIRQPDFSQCTTDTTDTTDMPPPDSPGYSGLLSPCTANALSKFGPTMRDYQSPPQSPRGSPVCPGAPLAPRFPAKSFGEAFGALNTEIEFSIFDALAIARAI
jgi:hypothetical protein